MDDHLPYTQNLVLLLLHISSFWTQIYLMSQYSLKGNRKVLCWSYMTDTAHNSLYEGRIAVLTLCMTKESIQLEAFSGVYFTQRLFQSYNFM